MDEFDTDSIEGFSDLASIRAGPDFTVLRAVDERGTAVLVKTTSSAFPSADLWSTLRAEYELGRGIRHDNIVETLDFLDTGSRPLLIVSDGGGEPLRTVVDRQRLSVPEVLRIAQQIAAGLVELHERDIVHRDIKPDNVIVDHELSHARIIDLGIATRVPRQETTIAAPEHLMGTLAYISPEQTGRTSRAVDHRSDLYSFGIMLYELLAGALPFDAPDPLEMVHQHLAVQPPSLQDGAPDAPPALCRLVERLIAKDPDDRYRSAVGLVRDLAMIADYVRRGQTTETLVLGGVDISARFQLPDRLFGRDEELAELRRHFDMAAEGRTSVLMIGGFSGIGKSSLIEELRPSVNQRRGYQAVGKIDQMDRGSAHHVILGSLRDLVRQLLTEDDRRVAALKAELLDALGPGAASLVEAVPELGALLGPLPPAPKLDAGNERNVFDQLISSFLSTVATAERPLVLVFDDLQWADTTTIDFVERIYRRVDGASLLVIGVYRDNEMDDGHPLRLLLRRLEEGGDRIPTIQLEPLDDDAMRQLVSTALNRPVEEAAPLVDLCISHTGSNPFFVRLFLQSLFEDRLLRLDQQSGVWSWDLQAIGARGITANVAELAMKNIGRVSPASRTTLAVMAIVGTEGDPRLLSEIALLGSDRVALDEALTELAAQQLIILTVDMSSTRWRIAHDRIQEAASQLLSEREQLEWHRRLGEVLQRRVDDGEETSIFTVLRHRNRAATGQVDPDLAKANLRGAQAAMRATSYAAAQRYFATGIALLGDDQWERDPETAFALHLGGADAARLATDFEEMDRLLGVIADQETDPLRRVEGSLIEILHLSHEGKNFAAVDAARRQLAELGWALSASPKLPTVIAGLAKTRLKLRPFSIDDLERLDEMEDQTARAMIRVMNETLSAAYFADPNILALLIQKGLQLTVEYGNAPESAFCYTSYGMIMSGIAKDPKSGVPYGDLGVRLADRYGPAAMPCRVRYARDALVAPVQMPLREIGPSLEIAYRVGTETGDVGYATAALLFISFHRLLDGVSLERLEEEFDAVCKRLARDAQDRNLTLARTATQFVSDLRHGPGPDGAFSGPHADGDDLIATAVESGDQLHLAWARTFRAMSRWHLGETAGARADLAAGKDYLDALLGQALLPVHHLYGALVEADASADGGSLLAAKRHRRKLAWFAKHNPTTHEAALLIADGAIAARRDKFAEAADRLTRAIEIASKRAAPHDVATAARVLVGVHERAGHQGAAARVREVMLDAYRSWGSPHLGSHPAAERTDPTAATGGTIRGTGALDGLDLSTVVRASEAIGEEIELDKLLGRLLDVTLRNAGAELGVLYRVDGDDVVIEAAGTPAVGSDGVDLSLGTAPTTVAESVVRLVARTAEPVIADRAVDDPYLRADPVVQQRGIRSLLCVPLLNQGRLHGILYLENNQVDGAFTTERIRLLRILSSQAASALEKARLLDAQTQLIAAQGRFVPVQFLESLGHSNLLAAELGQGILKDVDIVFTDIRGFTTTVENMTPADAMDFINDYLAHMEPVISEHGGFIDTYGGDAILALFDAGTDAGIKAAVAMATAEHRDNRARRAAGRAPTHTGIGINTDSIMMGIIGGPTRIQATIIGDGANLASRVESLTKRYGTSLLASEHTISRLLPGTELDLRPLERVLVVGRATPVRIFEVLDALEDAEHERRMAGLPQYLEAMEAYEANRFADAAEMFAEVARADTSDVAAYVLERRARELLDSGPTTEGPPVTRLDKK